MRLSAWEGERASNLMHGKRAYGVVRRTLRRVVDALTVRQRQPALLAVRKRPLGERDLDEAHRFVLAEAVLVEKLKPHLR